MDFDYIVLDLARLLLIIIHTSLVTTGHIKDFERIDLIAIKGIIGNLLIIVNTLKFTCSILFLFYFYLLLEINN